MDAATSGGPASDASTLPAGALELLCCPLSGGPLTLTDDGLYSPSADQTFALSPEGIPRFADVDCTEDAAFQKQHYDWMAENYVENLGYPHTREYMASLDRALLRVVEPGALGVAAEICCGKAEAHELVGERSERSVGVDVSLAMLQEARRRHPDAESLILVQGDATSLPLADASVDTVFMLGGIHHVNDRPGLFAEIFRILRPGGHFYFREPLDDFFLWRALRAVIYRVSPHLDHETERPLRREETLPVLEAAGFRIRGWRSHGFLGFCIFMNSDVLVFNRLFRYVPFIRTITRAFARLDEALLRLPGLRSAGLQVVGAAEKPSRLSPVR